MSRRSRRKVASQPQAQNQQARFQLTDKEIQARRINKAATLTSYNLGKTAMSDSAMGTAGGLYSAHLSSDFLQKPQNMRERRALWRHFYHYNEFVGAAIDLHSTIPLSRVRLTKPKCQNEHQSEYVYRFFTRMCADLRLFKVLEEISHEYWLIGNVLPYAEEHNPYEFRAPDGVTKEAFLPQKKVLLEKKMKEGKERAEFLKSKFNITDKDPNYKGWERIVILPPDQVLIEKPIFSPDPILEFVPDEETRKAMMNKGWGTDKDEAPYQVPGSIVSGETDKGANTNILLNTDPERGSHCHHIARKKSQYEAIGVSILERCVNTLILNDKLRQAQMMITDRHMTPIRTITAPELSEDQLEDLRVQVDLALMDPDFSVITNYELTWNEMGSNGRLLELATEYEHQENALFAGLGVTRDILTGESMYSGSKITLQVLDVQYMLFREVLQHYVEEYLFKPVARKKGFVEIDEYGDEVVLYPKLTFTRISVKDTDEFFNQVFQLYQKGSVSVDVILDLLNIDPESTRKKLEADLWTVNDPNFNNFMQGVYGAVSQKFSDSSNIDSLIAKNVGAVLKDGGAGEDAGMRFASKEKEKAQVLNNIADKLVRLDGEQLQKLAELLGAAKESSDD